MIVKMTPDHEKKLGRAKARLVMEHTFFATLVCNMPLNMRDDIPTAAVDGKRIYFNPDFLDTLSGEQTLFVLCHEVMHCVFAHMFRREGRDPYLWNVAGDFVINQLLKDENIGAFVDGCLYDPTIYAAGGMTTEGIYEYLLKNQPAQDPTGPGEGEGEGDGKGKSGGQPGGSKGKYKPLDWVEEGGSEADKAEAEAQNKIAIAQAAQAARTMGKLSAGLQRLVDQALAPVVDWKEVLRAFVSEQVKTDWSFAKPRRRYLSQDMYMPSECGEGMGTVAVFVDCSGSIGQRELSEFAAEITSLWEDTHPTELHVIYFDSKVSHHDKYSPGDTIEIQAHGGGGTAFSPLFRFINDNDITPKLAVVLTDLECSDFGPAPDYPVLWVCNTSHDRAPFGDVVPMFPNGQ